MLVDRWDKELQIEDEVIFIRRKFGTVLERGYINKIYPHAVTICQHRNGITGTHLMFKIMRPETDIYKI